ncbi:LINE-1 retrotransposable element ORF2 protein [Stylophora pistillata]|uniref:LINE-1 retrotransposable element ORF2 protein n=1 Tax=Stylophora pistillata TaxID=50429 RepID=A0A2B4S4K3_STYPI|nr:LINE-1 retrotransposable element ORF2 protein [Stylophora pistillata]
MKWCSEPFKTFYINITDSLYLGSIEVKHCWARNFTAIKLTSAIEFPSKKLLNAILKEVINSFGYKANQEKIERALLSVTDLEEFIGKYSQHHLNETAPKIYIRCEHAACNIGQKMHVLGYFRKENFTTVFLNAFCMPSSWSGHGCLLKSRNETYTECSCNHLTHFAVLIQFDSGTSGNSLTKTNEKALQIITYVGLSFSLVGIALTIISYALLTDMRGPLSQIRVSLVTSLGAGQIIFLTGIGAVENKGNKSDCGNYRGISLLSIAGKILARIILNRLIFNISEHNLPEAQCGFRPGRSTTQDMIFAVRQVQEKCREQNMDLYAVYVDLTKAFDTVNRAAMWTALQKLGCPRKFVTLIRLSHDSMTGLVLSGGEATEPFEITNGVKQGCVLAPVLFNLFIACVLSHAVKDIEDGVYIRYILDGSLFDLRRLNAKTKTIEKLILEALFADDCALMAHTESTLQLTVDKFAEASRLFGLTISLGKTELNTMLLGRVIKEMATMQHAKDKHSEQIRLDLALKEGSIGSPQSLMREQALSEPPEGMILTGESFFQGIFMSSLAITMKVVLKSLRSESPW